MKHIFYLSVACYKTEKKKLYTYIKKRISSNKNE